MASGPSCVKPACDQHDGMHTAVPTGPRSQGEHEGV